MATTPDWVKQYLENPREALEVEYKRSAPWEDLKLHILKTAMAMANLRDGGKIILGVREEKTPQKFYMDGITSDDLATYKSDDIQAEVNKYADPFIRLSTESQPFDGKTFLFIHVEPFTDIPIVCKKNASRPDPNGKSDIIELSEWGRGTERDNLTI